MTVQTLGKSRRRRHGPTARRRLPLDLAVLILAMAALYATARFFWVPPEPAAPSAPPAYRAPPPIPVLPPPPAAQGATPARQSARARPAHILPDPAASERARDPFEGLEPLSAAELDRISQAH